MSTSTGVCPYCGKPFKRLKSHLPHCKAKDHSKTRQDQLDVCTVSEDSLSVFPSSSQLPSKGTSKNRTPSKTSPLINQQTTKNKKASTLKLSPSTPLEMSPSLTASSFSPESMSMSSKKKTQSLADQVKMAAVPSSSTISIAIPLSSPRKPMKKSNQVAKGSLKQTKSVLSDQVPATCIVTDSTTSVPTTRPDNQEKGVKKSPPPPSQVTTPESASVSKSTPRKMSRQSFSATNISSVAGVRIGVECVAEPSESPLLTIQNTKDTLGRSHSGRRSRKPSILGRIQTSAPTHDMLPIDTKVEVPLHVSQDPTRIQAPKQNENCIGPLSTSVSQANQSPDLSSQAREQSLVESGRPVEAFKLPQSTISHFVSEVLTRPESISSSHQPTSWVPAPTSALTRVAAFCSVIDSKTDDWRKHHRNEMELLSSSVTRPTRQGTPAIVPSSSSPSVRCPCPSCPLSLPVQNELRTNNKTIMEDPELNSRNVTFKYAIDGNLMDRSLGQVKLRELPVWLAIKTPCSPREVVEVLQRGWLWYYRKYIDVKKGGVGGVAMMLTGYCVLGYVWNYPHIKHDRWRKYH